MFVQVLCIQTQGAVPPRADKIPHNRDNRTSFIPRRRPTALFPPLPGSGEDLPGVGADGVDGAVVTSDLSDGGEVVHVPHLQHAAAAGAQQHGPSRDVGQRAHPVLVGVGDLLQSRDTHVRRRGGGVSVRDTCLRLKTSRPST